MSKQKPQWYLETVNILRSYPMVKRELAMLDNAILSMIGPSTQVTQKLEVKSTGVNPEIRHDELSIRVDRICKAVDMLNDKQREIIKLRYFEELTFEKLCEIADLPRMTCYREHEKAIEKLSQILGIQAGLKVV